MNRLFTALLLLFVATLPAGSQPVPGACSALAPCYVTTTPGATTPVAGAQYGFAIVTAQTLTVPATAKAATVVVEGQNIRCTTDGATTPTASIGSLYTAGSVFTLYGTTLANFKCIQTASAATLDAEYFK